jgi:hypothetical protein
MTPNTIVKYLNDLLIVFSIQKQKVSKYQFPDSLKFKALKIVKLRLNVGIYTSQIGYFLFLINSFIKGSALS